MVRSSTVNLACGFGWAIDRNNHRISYLTYYRMHEVLMVGYSQFCDPAWRAQSLRPVAGSRELSIRLPPLFSFRSYARMRDMKQPDPFHMEPDILERALWDTRGPAPPGAGVDAGLVISESSRD